MMGILSWIVFGFFAGLIARAIFPGNQKLGFIAGSILGAILLLWIVKMVRK